MERCSSALTEKKPNTSRLHVEARDDAAEAELGGSVSPGECRLYSFEDKVGHNTCGRTYRSKTCAQPGEVGAWVVAMDLSHEGIEATGQQDFAECSLHGQAPVRKSFRRPLPPLFHYPHYPIHPHTCPYAVMSKLKQVYNSTSPQICLNCRCDRS